MCLSKKHSARQKHELRQVLTRGAQHTPGGNLTPADSVIEKSGVEMHISHNLVVNSIRRHTNFLRLICVMNHAVGVAKLDGNFGQSNVQRGNFRVFRPPENREQQQSTLGHQPCLGIPQQRIQIHAEIDVALRGLEAVQAVDALAEGTRFSCSGSKTNNPQKMHPRQRKMPQKLHAGIT
jgi:hypothetical protein